MTATRTALVTGAFGGIGRAVCARLESDGVRVLRTDLTTDGGDDSFASDCSDEQSVRDLVSWANTRVSHLDVVVTCAGVIDVSSVEHMSLAQWQRVIDVNLTGTFLALRESLPLVRRSSHGRLICIASDAGKTGEAGIAHYCASKFGVIGFAQSLALELINEPITVNCVCPVICDTPMMASLAEDFASVIGSGDAQEWRGRFVAEIPAGRACTPEDVAHAVSFLASEQSSFITGQSINVSGGHEVH